MRSTAKSLTQSTELIKNKDHSLLVTVIIPMLNEEKYIYKCIESLINNDFPMNEVEFLVIDGMSEDNSRQIVKDLAEKYKNIFLLSNPLRKQVHALNIGIEASHGEIIIRADAHCIYQKDYLTTCVRLLQLNIADNVGGMQFACGDNYVTNGIAFAFRSHLGSGNADYRVSRVEKYTDTVFLGAWLKKKLQDLGCFDPSLDINEDYELNVRILKSGGKIYYTPHLKTVYFVRSGIFKLSQQYYKYGNWKTRTLSMHKSSIKIRQAILPLYIASMFTLLCMYPLLKSEFLLIPIFLYLFACLLGSIFPYSKTINIRYFPATFLAIVTMHISWTLGFCKGYIENIFRKTRLKKLVH